MQRHVELDESQVLRANEAFYAAFQRRQLADMDAVWSSRLPVACIHPGWPAVVGHDQVMETWRAILGSPSSPEVECDQALVHLYGDTAYVICLERVPGGALLAATNVFAREREGWKLVHHQAGPCQPPAELAQEPSPSDDDGVLH